MSYFIECLSFHKEIPNRVSFLPITERSTLMNADAKIRLLTTISGSIKLGVPDLLMGPLKESAIQSLVKAVSLRMTDIDFATWVSFYTDGSDETMERVGVLVLWWAEAKRRFKDETTKTLAARN